MPHVWQWLHDHLVAVWQWVHDLAPSQATFLGSLTGAAIGLVALMLGALFNAHLNRRRDDRLRREDEKTLTAALLAELRDFRACLQHNIDTLNKAEKELYISYIPSIRILPDFVAKVGLLNVDTVQKVMRAYNVAETLGENQRRVPKEGRPLKVDRRTADAYLRTLEWGLGIQDAAILALGARPGGEDWYSPPPEWWRIELASENARGMLDIRAPSG